MSERKQISHFCDICKDEDKTEEAIGFCTKCEQYLCTVCKQYHQRIAATRHHNILGENDMPAKSRSDDTTSSKEETKHPLCPTHKGMVLNFYCDRHEQAICKTCKLLDHRKCKNVSLLTYIKAKTSDECSNLLEYAKIIKDSFEHINSAKSTELEELISEKNKSVEKIKKIRGQFNLLEQQAMKEVEDIFEVETKVIKQEADTIKQSQMLISATIIKLENVIIMGTQEEKFVVEKSAMQEFRKYEDILQDTRTTSTRQMEFTENGQVSKIKSFGHPTLTKKETKIKSFPGAAKTIITETSADNENHSITAMEILSDGKQLFLDFYNKILKLYSTNNLFLGELELPGKAASMVLLNDRHLLLAIPTQKEQSLQMVEIENDVMKLGSHLPTLLQQWLLTRYSNTHILALSTNGYGQWQLQIFDHAGLISKSSIVDIAPGLLKIPFDIALNHDSNKIYITDYYNGCLGVTLDGDKVFHYKDDLHNGYMGLAVSTEGLIYIGYVISNENIDRGNIVTLSADGKKVKNLFPVDRSVIIPLKCLGNKMFLCTNGTDIGYIFYKLL